MSGRKYLGGLMVSTPFLGVTYMWVVQDGWLIALGTWVISFTIVALVYFGVKLLIGERDA